MKVNLNIKELMQKRNETPLRMPFKNDSWLQEVTESDKEYEYLIGIAGFSFNREYKEIRENLLKKYYINAIIDLANFLPMTGIKLNLYIFSKHKPDKIKIATYKENIRVPGYKNSGVELPKSYPQKYELYLSEVENFVNNNNILPKDTSYCEFNEILYKDLDIDTLSSDRYSKDYYKLQEILKKENTITLGECADVVRPKVDSKNKDEKVPTLKAINFKYPLDIDNLPTGPKTDTVLKKGDILTKPYGGFNVYLIAEEPEINIYAGPNDFVIRSKNEKYSPEYLYVYFKSETYQNMAKILSKGTTIQRITKKDLLDIKIIIPTQKDQDYYRQLFRLGNYKNIDYDEIQDLVNNNQIDKKENLEDILDAELISKAKNIKDKALGKILEEDLNEINLCFKAKAYKATLVLCGAVLEAFLLDWLNELEPGEGWYEIKKYEIKTGKNKGKKIDAGLSLYIDKIAKISAPPWMKGMKENAHHIREQRNLVHARLCLKPEVQINEELCKDVISYLKDILNTR